jgi:hypothetical protein
MVHVSPIFCFDHMQAEFVTHGSASFSATIRKAEDWIQSVFIRVTGLALV